MTVRPARPEDREAITGIAERSLRASYSLSPAQIETVVEEEFSAEPLAARIEDGGAIVVVAEVEGRPVGFADADRETSTLRWLHVDPTERGDGVGTALAEWVIAELGGGDEPFTAEVLNAAREGGSFLERVGLQEDDTRPIKLGDEQLSAHVYTTTARDAGANEPAVPVPDRVDVDGAERPVGDEAIPGTEAPFFVTYASVEEAERYGFFCSSCGSTDVSAGDHDSLECGECGNKHRADEWDDAYL